MKKRESPEVGISDIEVFTFSLDHFVTNSKRILLESFLIVDILNSASRILQC